MLSNTKQHFFNTGKDYVKIGTLKGATLSPGLFYLYINDLLILLNDNTKLTKNRGIFTPSNDQTDGNH